MNATEIQTALSKYADSDLRIARKDGEMAVCDTMQGTVFVRYENGEYSISSSGLTGRELARGRKAIVKAVLMSLYKVEPEYAELTTVCADYAAWNLEVQRMMKLGYEVQIKGSVPGKSMRMTRNATAYTITF